MALNSMGLGFLFTAKDLASGTIRGIGGNLKSLGGISGSAANSMNRSFNLMATGAGIAGAGVGGLAVAFEAAGKAGEFERGVAAVGAVTNATAAQLGMLRDAAINAGIATQFSPTEAIGGLQELATAGQTAEQSVKTLVPVLDLAAGSLGQIGISEASTAVVGTLNAFSLSAEQAGETTDKLLKIMNISNFQARDFSAGLSKASATGAAFKQTLDDVLVSMGLMRNRNLDASSSATAFREAIRRLGSDQGAQKAVAKAGVEIFDKQTGAMRGIFDITNDLVNATKNLTDKKRNQIIVDAYGARGLMLFQAVQSATFTTMQNGQQVTLKGAAAIAAMQREMKGASGTAAKFRDALLDTFEGQKTLLKGSLETLAVVSGKAFADVFRPLVSGFISATNTVIAVVNGIPTPVKTAFAAIFVGVSAMLAFAGSTVLGVGAVMLLLPAIKIAAVVLGGLLLAMLPVIVAGAAVALVFVGIRQAAEKNIGGLGDMFGSSADKIHLAFDALSEFFSKGKISFETTNDLLQSKNSGVFNFVNSVVILYQKLQALFSGIGKGFSSGLEQSRPTIVAFKQAWESLSSAIGEVFGGKNDPQKSMAGYQKFGTTGQKIGHMLAGAFRVIVGAITLVIRGLALLITAGKALAPAFTGIKKQLDPLGKAFELTGGSSNKMGDGMLVVHAAVALLTWSIGTLAAGIRLAIFIFTTIVGVISSVVSGVRSQVMAIVGIVKGAGMLIDGIITGDWSKAWAGLKLIVGSAIKGAINVLAAGIRMIVVMIDAAAAAIGKPTHLTDKFDAQLSNMNTRLDKTFGLPVDKTTATPVSNPSLEEEQRRINEAPTTVLRPLVAPAAAAANAAIAPTAAASVPAHGGSSSEQLASAMHALAAANARPPQPVNINLLLDGEVLARKQASISHDGKETSFTPGGGGAPD